MGRQFSPRTTLGARLAPVPRVFAAPPTTSDFAELGTVAVVKSPYNDVFILQRIENGQAQWLNVAGGAGVFDSLETLTGPVTLLSTQNQAQTIYLHANGGTTETIEIRADQGTAVNSLNFHSDVGGISLDAGLSAVNAMVLNASGAAGQLVLRAGSNGILVGTDADTAVISIGDVIPTSARTVTISGGTIGSAIADTLDIAPDGVNFAGSSKVVNIATGAATLGTQTVNIATASAAGTQAVNVGNADNTTALDFNGSTITIDANAASNFTVTGAADLTLSSTLGSVIVNSEEAAADAVRLLSAAGGLDADFGLQVNIASSQAAADALRLVSSAGGIDVDATGSAGVDIDLTNTGGSINLVATELVPDAIRLLSSDGIDIDATGTSGGGVSVVASGGQMLLQSAQAAAADSVRIRASAADGGIDVDSGTGGHTIDSTGAISIDAAADSNFSVSGAGIDLTLASAAGRVVVNGEEAAADALRLLSAAGGLDADVALQMNLTSSQAAAADSIRIFASAADGGIDIDAGTGGITMDSTGVLSLDSAGATNLTATGAFDVTLSSTAGSMIVDGGEAVADAVQIRASNAAGGVVIEGNGLIDIEPVNVTTAGASSTNNVLVGMSTQTGLTTASAASETVTITNSQVATSSGILVQVAVAGAEDAQMNIRKVRPLAGSFTVEMVNDGAAALASDLILSYIILNP